MKIIFAFWGIFITSGAFAGQCPDTVAEMDALLQKKMPHADFSYTSQHDDHGVLKLCEVLKSQTKNCSYLEGNFESSYFVGRGYNCQVFKFKNEPGPSDVFLFTSGIVQVDSEMNYVHFGNKYLAKDAFNALEESGNADLKKSWSLLKFKGKKWRWLREATQEEAEKNGNYSYIEHLMLPVSKINIIRSSKQTIFYKGEVLDGFYRLEVRSK